MVANTMMLVFLILFGILIYKLELDSSKFRRKRKERHTQFVERVRNEWNCIPIQVSDCDWFPHVVTVDANSPTYQLLDEKDSIFTRKSSKYEYTRYIDLNHTKLLCYYEVAGKEKQRLTQIVPMDITVVAFKLQLKTHIYLYEDPDDDTYKFLDLEFLKEELELS